MKPVNEPARKENRYAKKEIHRVMRWNEQKIGEDFKFDQLKHYFKLYFRIKDTNE